MGRTLRRLRKSRAPKLWRSQLLSVAFVSLLSTAGLSLFTQTTAFADTEVIGDTTTAGSTGWVDVWFAGCYDATGAPSCWYYSEVNKAGNVVWEDWLDYGGNYYLKLVQDGWYGELGSEYGYTDEADVYPSGGTASHYEYSTLIATAYENPSLGCPWPANPPFEPCDIRTTTTRVTTITTPP
ncbi:MAG TPA: hypothetical protein VFB34_06815 [Chloroflexota bacterium]|nr:hypothetical protein [Chloroflexota bacterium]